MSFSSNYCSDFSQSNKIISNTEKKDNLYDINNNIYHEQNIIQERKAMKQPIQQTNTEKVNNTIAKLHQIDTSDIDNDLGMNIHSSNLLKYPESASLLNNNIIDNNNNKYSNISTDNNIYT